MKTWNHTSKMDHLRRRAEGFIEKARIKEKSSIAAGGEDAVDEVERTDQAVDVHNSVNAVPAIGEMTGGFNSKT